MTYDPSLYRGSAAYYARGRPPYSAELSTTLSREVGLDDSSRLLDVGCGPGILTLELSDHVGEAVGLDPDADMLAEAARRAAAQDAVNVRWVRGVAEDLATLELGSFRLVTFGQSFQWTDRARTAELVYDILEPGGALAVVFHAIEGRPRPQGPGPPPIPHDAIRALLNDYLGPRERAGQGFRSLPAELHEEALAPTRFGTPRSIVCLGRPDIVRDTDGVVAGYLSTSFAAPHLFGERLGKFETDLRAVLDGYSSSGLFWDWPGDTEILLARK